MKLRRSTTAGSKNGSSASGATHQPAASDVCVARQPIFDTTGVVSGYELLYRRISADSTPVDAVHAFLNIGLEQLTSGRPAFLDFTREMLLGGAHSLLPPDAVVIELLKTVEPDEAVEHACEELVDTGYALALDDFVWSTRYRRLLELATIVKVDVLQQGATHLDEVAQRVAPYDVRLLADRVETADVRGMCAGLGYELFQGCYFARPEIVKNRALSRDELAIVQAMTVMRDPRATDAELEAAFASSSGLSYRLLRMVNSGGHGGLGIESIRHALQLSGRAELSRWLALLLVSSIAARGATNRELLHLAVQRGRMCELLGVSAGDADDPSALFLVGLFSLLDAISGIPMPQLLESISLAPALRHALVGRTGAYAGALSLAEAYQQGAWTIVHERASSSGLAAAHVGALYVQSLAWTRERLLPLALG